MKQQNITFFQNQKIPISQYEGWIIILVFNHLIKNREGRNLSIQKKNFKVMTKICLKPGGILYRMKVNLIREVHRKLLELMNK